MKLFIVAFISLISLNTFAGSNSLITCDEGVSIEVNQDGQKQIVISNQALIKFLAADVISSQSLNDYLEFVSPLTLEDNHLVTSPNYGTYFEVPTDVNASSGELTLKSIVPCGGATTEYKFSRCH